VYTYRAKQAFHISFKSYRAYILSPVFFSVLYMVLELQTPPMENTSQSNSSSSSLSSVSLTSKTNPVSFNHNISIKLSEKFFLLWHQQVATAIKGYDLQKYAAREEFIPEKFSSTEDATAGKVSADFVAWEKQDQLLLSWLPSSMSEDMLT